MKDAVLPLSRPIRTTHGETLSSLVVPQGTNIIIGIMALNRQKSLWGADALEWKPERWLAPLPQTVSEAGVPGVYSNMCVADLRSPPAPRRFVSVAKLRVLIVCRRRQDDVPRRRTVVCVSAAA